MARCADTLGIPARNALEQEDENQIGRKQVFLPCREVLCVVKKFIWWNKIQNKSVADLDDGDLDDGDLDVVSA